MTVMPAVGEFRRVSLKKASDVVDRIVRRVDGLVFNRMIGPYPGILVIDDVVPETRQPDPGLTPLVAGWVRGDDLSAVLEDGELTGGDFVRNVKQCIDLLRQIGDVAPDPATAATARAAADACSRGVVAASSAVTVP